MPILTHSSCTIPIYLDWMVNDNEMITINHIKTDTYSALPFCHPPCLTCRPTAVLPVNDSSPILSSAAISLPTSVPPCTSEQMAPGRPFVSSTRCRIRVMATETRGVLGAPFHITVLPHV